MFGGGGIGMAFGCFHDLAHEETEGGGFALLVVGDGGGIVFDGRLHPGCDLGVVGDFG